MKLKRHGNNCTHQSFSAKQPVGESGVNNANPWLYTNSESQFLVEPTHPFPAYYLNTHLHQFSMKHSFAFKVFVYTHAVKT